MRCFWAKQNLFDNISTKPWSIGRKVFLNFWSKTVLDVNFGLSKYKTRVLRRARQNMMAYSNLEVKFTHAHTRNIMGPRPFGSCAIMQDIVKVWDRWLLDVSNFGQFVCARISPIRLSSGQWRSRGSNLVWIGAHQKRIFTITSPKV